MNKLSIAFLPPCINGHSNVHVVAIQNLISLEPHKSPPLHIHVVADEPLRKRIEALVPLPRHRLTFYSSNDKDHFRQYAGPVGEIRKPQPSLFGRGGMATLNHLPKMTFPPVDIYMAQFLRLKQILEGIKPDLAMADVLLPVGVDACKAAGVRYGMMSPNSSLDWALWSQPGGRGFWKYPMLASTTPFPVPLYLIPLNIFMALYIMIKLVTSAEKKALEAARREAGLTHSALRQANEGAVFILTSSIYDIEYPHVPFDNNIFAGPILNPEPVLSSDKYPDLAQFLSRGRTAFFNMGSAFKYDPNDVVACLSAFKIARERLRSTGRMYVLWKLPGAESFMPLFDQHLGTDWSEWVRVEEWIEPQALAVLQHPNIFVSVHHGGANSFHEACYAGVPQIIHPQWYDLYTNAVRAEWLGIGVHANKGHDAEFHDVQFADALERVSLRESGQPGHAMKTKADGIAKVCQAARGGQKAAQVILAAA